MAPASTCSGASRPLIITIPHSGEEIPPQCSWLKTLPPEVLLLDVDRFVDRLYAPAIEALQIPAVIASVHRYAVDLNRTPEDMDAATVVGAPLAAGTHTQGIHWARSTQGHVLLESPMPMALHHELISQFHDPFHAQIQKTLAPIRAGFSEVFHLDCHSMPSRGTGAHADSGKTRPEVVLSDFEGKSSRRDFMDVLQKAFVFEGFEVSINWPYKGGRITQRYGKPTQGHHTIQIELNRALYMDEQTREPIQPAFDELSLALGRVLATTAKFVDQVSAD